jgi:alpha-L-fucosidase 2
MKTWVNSTDYPGTSFLFPLYAVRSDWHFTSEANVWMMIHAYDRLSFTNDLTWWRRQGWPLLKGVALFHLQKLIPDKHFNDGTLVTAPCNSPEQAPTTFGCTHQQTMIWELFNAVEKGYPFSGDSDEAFLQGM